MVGIAVSFFFLHVRSAVAMAAMAEAPYGSFIELLEQQLVDGRDEETKAEIAKDLSINLLKWALGQIKAEEHEAARTAVTRAQRSWLVDVHRCRSDLYPVLCKWI